MGHLKSCKANGMLRQIQERETSVAFDHERYDAFLLIPFLLAS